MKNLILVIISALAIFSFIILIRSTNNKDAKETINMKNQNVRQPAVAGTFYPADARQLQETINHFLKTAQKPKEIKGPRIIIVPHAGYDYSGAVAVAGFKTIEGQNFSRVIILGDSHQQFFEGAKIDDHDAWQTPLGQVDLDTKLAKKLTLAESQIELSSYAHKSEHSLEVQLPFLQTVLKDFKILPILLSHSSSKQQIEKLASLLAQEIDESTLLLISTDLSHYPNYDIAQQVDKQTIKSIISGRVDQFEKTIQEQMAQDYPNLETCACASSSIKTALLVAQKLANGQWQKIKYANSADTTGDSSQVVGYASIIFAQSQEQLLTDQEKQTLLKIARDALTSYLSGATINQYQIDNPKLTQKLGVFVTLHKNGQLRGCIGEFEPNTPLWQTVINKAIDAAVNDPRFPPVAADELDQLEIEISILSKPKKINNWQEIRLGKHGVIIKNGPRGGTFLPQVAEETGWSLKEFLENLCLQKANLPKQCYQDPKTEIFIYTADVFSEKN